MSNVSRKLNIKKYLILSKCLLVDLLTCGRTGHGLVLWWCRLPRLVHIDVVHRRTLHRTSGAEGSRVAGWSSGLVHHPSCHIGRQRLHLHDSTFTHQPSILFQWQNIHIGLSSDCRWWSMHCVPGRRAERKQAFGLSSGSCASAAPDASASPSPAPGGAGWPAVFASPGTPAVQRHNACEHGDKLRIDNYVLFSVERMPRFMTCFFCLMISSFCASWICLCLSASSAARRSFSLCSSRRALRAARASRTWASLSCSPS